MGVAQRIVLGVSVFAVVVLGFSSAAPAGRRVPPQKIALAAVARLQAAGRIDPADAARYRKAISRAVALIPRVPASRATPLRSQLAQAAAIAPKLTAPRALAVFSQLEVNDDWFASHGPAASQTDITDADGVVYRYFSGGFEFHPLGNFAALNADALTKNVTATTRLANALADRAVPEAAGGAGWEYYFDYGGGRAPWTSGFAQVVAAQSFARAAKVDTADSARLLAAARSAYRAVPGRLVRDTSFGPWIRLYSFNHAVVLNAQLQAAISLASYAKLTSDSQAGTLAAEMTTAAARALPSFTTGYWSYYELPGEPSPVSYQNYVVELLQTLARADDRFAPAATEFAGFGTKPPAFRLGDAGVGAVNFWVSKPSSVRVSALGRDRWLSVSGGWHTVSWQLPSRAGIFPVTIHATDWAGNGASVEALPIVRVVAPPKKPHKAARSTSAVAAASLPPLVVGAGLQQPAQAGLALSQGLGAVRMTLVWPTGASVPDPGAITALNRLPAGTNLVLDLYLSAVPPDSSALAAYAASVAAQVPALRDLIVGPGPGSAAESAAYEAALAAVYDAVKAAAPAVRVAGALDGSGAPKASLAAMAAALKASGRAGPVMDELAFTPAPAAGKNLWTLADVSKLVDGARAGVRLVAPAPDRRHRVRVRDPGRRARRVLLAGGRDDRARGARPGCRVRGGADRGRLQADGRRAAPRPARRRSRARPAIGPLLRRRRAQDEPLGVRGRGSDRPDTLARVHRRLRHPGTHAEPHAHSGAGADADSCAGPVAPDGHDGRRRDEARLPGQRRRVIPAGRSARLPLRLPLPGHDDARPRRKPRPRASRLAGARRISDGDPAQGEDRRRQLPLRRLDRRHL